MSVRHLLTIADLSSTEFEYLIGRSIAMKKRPEAFAGRLQGKTLLAIFSKPSLRTRLSLETAMTRLGGHAIYYELGSHSNLWGKESARDTSEVFSRLVDVCSARLRTRKELEELVEHSKIPCINALDDWAHPLQMVGDFMTIRETFGKLDGVILAYCGDARNNVTYDLVRASLLLGVECRICCPKHPDFQPSAEFLNECSEIIKKMEEEKKGCPKGCPKGSFRIFHDVQEGVRNADVVYTDSWMSYHIPEAEREGRRKVLRPFQVTEDVMEYAAPHAVFMNCLPATRGDEQTAAVIDGPRSVCYAQAGNRLHSAMAVLDFLLHDCKMENPEIPTQNSQ